MKEVDYVFGSYTLKQVHMIEREYYTIRFEGDFFNEEGYYLFTMSQAKAIYASLVKDLAGVVHDGIEKDKKLAADILLGMIVEPVRYH